MPLLVLFFIVLTVACLNAKDLNEHQKLKIENLKLKIAVAQLQATLADRESKLASVELSNEQSKLLVELRKQLGADEKDTFDWDKLVFIKPAPAAK